MTRIGIIGNDDRPRVRETLALVLEQLPKHFRQLTIGLSESMAALYTTKECEVHSSLYDLAKASDIVISIGGDGTMLMGARAIQRANPNANLIGINVGKLGFLSEHPPEEIDLLLSELAGKKLAGEARLMLRATVRSDSGQPVLISKDNLEPTRDGTTSIEAPLDALNEVVIDNYGSTRMLSLEVFVNGALLGAMRADGIMIATPTGSTGYAVSAGGPIVEPTSRVMLITPIAPHSLNIRPIIVPEDAIVSVRSTSDEQHQVLVVADGQEQVIVSTPALVTVQAAQHRLKLLRRSERSYFDLLRTKMFWSADSRDGSRR